MGLTQLNFQNKNKIEEAIAVIQTWEPSGSKYQVCFSGGKDSQTAEDLTMCAEVPHDLVYNQTGIEHPELIYFMRDYYPQIQVTKPKMTIWEGVFVHGLPTRKVRWCCELLKEYSGKDRVLITGLRAAESVARKRRCLIETGRKNGKVFINPIFNWSTAEVWEYIHQRKMPYCSLYDKGFDRLGCILCPMTTHEKTLDEWELQPKMAQAWFRAGRKYWEKMYPRWKAKGSRFFEMFPTPNDYIWWWLTRGQVSINEMKYKAEKRGLALL